MTEPLSYVLVTAARNEAQFIELTLKSVVAQTQKPLKWVIVSDGSNDGTDDIVAKYAAQYCWIDFVRLPEHADRHFAGKVGAFNAGYARLEGLDYEVIGNLDADVSFEEDYLEFLVAKFAADPHLGVTGTPYHEENRVHDESFKSPEHVSGACQMFRRQCFEDIGGYKPVKSGGIDLIALLSAQANGWRTRRYDERVCEHHRTVGSGMHSSLWRRQLNLGKKDYLLGSHPVFEVLRAANQMTSRPYLIAGGLILVGYFWALLRRLDRTMPQELIVIRQADQVRRLKNVLRHPMKQLNGRTAAARP